METKLEREVRFLKACVVGGTLLGAVLVLTAFTLQNARQKFGEIDVERINIVEKDGKLRMVISNEERQHPGIVNGKIISELDRVTRNDFLQSPGGRNGRPGFRR